MAQPPPGLNPFGPSGVLLDDPQPVSNRLGTILGVSITLTVLNWMSTSARIWIRLCVAKTPGWDDLFVVLTLLLFTMLAGTFCVSTKFGMGRHIFLIDPKLLPKFALCQYLGGVGYEGSAATIKISILLQYLRVFNKGTFTYRFTLGVLIMTSLWGFAFTFISFFPCFPNPSNAWNKDFKGCYGFFSPDATLRSNLIKAHAGCNVFFDVLLLSLAFRIQFVEKIPTTRRSIIALLLMGCVSFAFAIWRLAVISVNGPGKSMMDLTWNYPNSALLSLAELYIASLCATIPFFWPVVINQLNQIFVKYEFNVSTESRFGDDEIELAHTGSLPARIKSTNGREEIESFESRPGNSDFGKKPKVSHYGDTFVQQQTTLFTGESHGNEDLRGGTTSQSKVWSA